MKKRQQGKLSYKPMLYSIEYLDYIPCDLGGLHPTNKRSNQFDLGFWDDITGVYYAEPMKTKNQIFDMFQKFICQEEGQSEKKLKYLHTDFGGEFANKTFEK